MEYNIVFNRYRSFLDTIEQLPLFTTSEDSIINVNENKHILINRICLLLKEKTFERGKLVFRGQKREYLHNILVKDPNDNSDITLYNNLFFFGEKAACFYSIEPNSEDINQLHNKKRDLFHSIQYEIKRIRSHNTHKSFTNNNKRLFAYFLQESNAKEFEIKTENNILFSSYYESFLHSLGKRKGVSSQFLSSSLLYNIAASFAEAKDISDNLLGNTVTPLILVYAMPQNIISIAAFENWITKQKQLEIRIKDAGLPIFIGKWIYNHQCEYILHCGMLPQLLWLVIDLNNLQMIANPHMFERCNKNKSLWLSFDQTGFLAAMAEQTNYRFGYAIDGLYYPHLLQPFSSL